MKLKAKTMTVAGFIFLIFIRIISFGSIPGGFNQDGALAAVDALSLAAFGTDHFGTYLPAHLEAWSYGQMSSLLSYLMVPFIKLWGFNSVTARMPLLLASIAGSVAVYVVVKELFGEKCGAITAWFLAINPWHFMQSRWALDCNLFPHMFIIGLCFLVKGLKNIKWTYISMIFFALCMYSYGVAFYMVPIFLLIAAIYLYRQKKVTAKQLGIAIGVYFGLAWPIYGTMLINFMGWETVSLPFVTMQSFPGTSRVSDMLPFSENIGQQFVSNVKSFLNVTILQKPDLPWNALDKFGTMYLFSMPFILGGLVLTGYRAFKKEEVSGKKGNSKKVIYEDKDNKIGNTLLMIYWISSLFVGIFINGVNINRINIIFYSHIIFAGVAISFIVEKVKLLLAAIALVYGIACSMFLSHYFGNYSEEIADIFFEDFLTAIDVAESFQCDRYYITPDSQYTGSWHVSQVMTWYGMEMDAAYLIGEDHDFLGKQIPYSQRFYYYLPETPDTNGFVGYVIETVDAGFYSSDIFVKIPCGDYTVMVTKY